MQQKNVVVRLEREQGLRLRIRLEGEGRTPLLADEPPPLGEGSGASAIELLASAVGTCLSQSLLFCLERSRVKVEDLGTDVEVQVARNEKGRLRISEIRVTLAPVLASSVDPDANPGARLDRCAGIFEDFCTVAGSLDGAIPVTVTVAEPSLQG